MLDFSTNHALVEINYSRLKIVGIIVHRNIDIPSAGLHNAKSHNPNLQNSILQDYMKKILLSAIALFIATSTVASAQVNIANSQTPNATVEITARVVAPLTVNNVRDMDFGIIAQGQNPTIEATDAASAQFSITKSANAPVLLTWVLPATLSGPSSGSIAISYLGSYTTDIVTAATAYTPGSDVNLDTAVTAASSVTLNLGASLTTTGSTPVGDYTGTVTLTINYNAL